MFRRLRLAVAAIVAMTLGLTGGAVGEPALDRAFNMQGVLMFPDHERGDVYYVAPTPIGIAERPGGAPGVGLRLTYYYGTELRGDAGERDVSWVLSVDLERGPMAARETDALKTALSRQKGVPAEALVLRTLPVISVPTDVVYTPIVAPSDAAGEPGAAIQLSDGYAEARDDDEEAGGEGAVDEEGAAGSDESYWLSRRLSFHLSPEDGQVMRRAFEESGAVMSVSYAYRAAGVVLEEGAMGTADGADGLSDAPDAVWTPTSRLVGANALRVEVDAETHPDFLTLVDLNARAPPGYPTLSFICSDFVTPEEDWSFYTKIIDIEAVGVAGRPVRTQIEFPLDDPQVSLRGAAFQYAVRVDRPFRYRVTAYPADAYSYRTKWIEVEKWGPPINISGDYAVDDRENTENGE